METKFIADVMLGRLSKWLRVMDYDTYHQMCFEKETIRRSIEEGRIFLSRRAQISKQVPSAIWVPSNHVGEQLRALAQKGILRPHRSKWFRRCIVCNVPLRKAAGEISMESVPDYILQHKILDISWCPACHRLFWAGTHREKMIHQLKEWGF